LSSHTPGEYLASQTARSHGAIALVYPLAQHADRRLIIWTESEGNPTGSTEATAGFGEGLHQGDAVRFGQLDRDRHPTVGWHPEEDEDLASDLDNVLTPRMVLVALG